MEEKLIATLKDYFARYPKSEEVYMTDGLLFHLSGDAKGYGSGIAKRYTRHDIQEAEASHSPDGLAEQIRSGAVEVDSMSYEEMKQYAQSLGLRTADQKKTTIAEALKALADNKEIY